MIRALALIVMLWIAAAENGFAASAPPDWPLWRQYVAKFVQQDGRTVDFAANGGTTSEGQAYTLFFALVANDRETFDKVLAWTRDNLAGGDLSARLPAWSWGQRPDKTWGVIDANSASDADLWMSYALIEAGRLWRESRYRALGEILASRIEKDEVVDLPGTGMMLIPGAAGFKLDDGWRLNPSYLPIQVLRRLAESDPIGPWSRIAENTLKLLEGPGKHGLAPDWAAFRNQQGFIADPVKGDVGSFDAIRVYLWAGMLSPDDKLRSRLLDAVFGMRDLTRASLTPPERVHVLTGRAEGSGSPGFSAALLPYFAALGESRLLQLQQKRLEATRIGALLGPGPNYYDQVLALFGEGWIEKKFSFDLHGRCVPAWEK